MISRLPTEILIVHHQSFAYHLPNQSTFTQIHELVEMK
uniref:Uncharacterized protein n=1 Tax=Manihot esculenta TaxID=3983 RepID=A0A2C9W1C9_MANES